MQATLSQAVQEFRFRLVAEPERLVEVCGPADITAQTTVAIVNAANSSLLGGGGVDGAIHRAGGPTILDECRKYVSQHGRLSAGKAIVTSGGKLAARFVIHTVGPVFVGGDRGEADALASCHRESIRLADEQGIVSLSFPAISTGAYGYPLKEAATVALSSVFDALAKAKHVERARFVLFDRAAVAAYLAAGRSAMVLRTRWMELENRK